MRTKIGLWAIAAMPPNSIIWDTEIPGLNVRRQFSNVLTYSIVYRTLEGVQRWQRIGRHGVWTPDLARKQARSVLMARDLGKDPSADRMALRSAPTVADLCDEYCASDNGKKPATIKADNSRIKQHIKPKLGKLKVTLVTSDHVEDFMRNLSAGSKTRTVGLLGAIFSYGIKRKIITVNPCAGVKKPPDVKKTRRLSDAEYQQLQKAIYRVSNSIVANIFTMIAITGWRSSEVRLLKFSECDLERQVATLGDTKSGISVRPLSVEAVKIIEAQPKRGPYVFEYEHARPVNNLRPYWLNLNMSKDVTPHSLRHSYASLAGDMGMPDHTIARLLGHKQSSITSRYIHMEKSVIEASDLVAQETLRLMRI
jgi:integrase